MGLTRLLYRVSMVVRSRVWKVRRIQDDMFLADSTMLFMCVLKVPLDESVTPRSFTILFSSIRLKDGDTQEVEDLSSVFVP